MLVEKHLISPELASLQRPCGAILSSNEEVSVMVGEEDHVRIQVIRPGLCLEECLKEAFHVDDKLDGAVTYAFDEKLGYLTACPTNLGTALRASVMLHLSVLTESGAIREIVTAVGKMGLAVRGLYGEGSQIQGALYQVSNQNTLGLTEQEIVSRVSAVVEHIITQEKTLRDTYKTRQANDFKNRVWRAWGALSNARLLPGEETMSLLSDLRLGVSEGELPPVPMTRLNDLLRDIQVGALTQAAGHILDSDERDVARADLVRSTLNQYT
jgi:protein arginine kinase